jgi:hypothetical protein
VPEEANVIIENLRSHGGKVDEVVDQLTTAVQASQEVSLSNDAYGILCQPFAMMLEPVEQHGIQTLQKAVEAMQETAENVRASAEDYQSVDDGNRDIFKGIQI